MLSVYLTMLEEVNIHLTRALESLEDVPREAFGSEEDLFRVVELIAKAGQIVASAELRQASEAGESS